ncbi:uncharacterized protein LOC143225536 isoform X2 [Tachypleus tridentatus]|uniref:uncharacterized protein LOC143225536 isoform X2 n=1 Tax=Tachypleus tridentatus TaxID=6853 RepID=UPI003FD68A96
MKQVKTHKSPKKIKCKTLVRRKPLMLLNGKQKTIHSFFDMGKEGKDRTNCHQVHSANGKFLKLQGNCKTYQKSSKKVLPQSEVCERTEAISPQKNTVHPSTKPQFHSAPKDSDSSRYFTTTHKHLEHVIRCRKLGEGAYNFQHYPEIFTLDSNDCLDLNSQKEDLVPFVPIPVSSLDTQLSLESSHIGEFIPKTVSSSDMQCNFHNSSQVEGSFHKAISTFNIQSSFVPSHIGEFIPKTVLSGTRGNFPDSIQIVGSVPNTVSPGQFPHECGKTGKFGPNQLSLGVTQSKCFDSSQIEKSVAKPKSVIDTQFSLLESSQLEPIPFVPIQLSFNTQFSLDTQELYL